MASILGVVGCLTPMSLSSGVDRDRVDGYGSLFLDWPVGTGVVDGMLQVGGLATIS